MFERSVVVASAALALAALQSGAFVVLEKPLAPTVAACQRILHAAQNSPGCRQQQQQA